MKLSQLHGHLLIESLELSEATGAGEDVFRLLEVIEASGADYILVGGHSISSYTGAPRATKDVDIVSADGTTITKAVQRAFPDVIVNDTPVATRIMRPDPHDPENPREFLDIIKPKGGNAFYKNVFNDPTSVDYGRSKVRIPNLETAIGAKFAAMVSPHRPVNKVYQDAADFIQMVRVNPDLNLKLLQRLGEQVYNGGGREILQKIEAARKGEKFSI